MALLIDPDDLNVATELVLDETATPPTFQLVATGNLVAKDGASGQALYSKFVDLWTTAAYNKYPFPAYVIGDPRAGMFVFGFDGASYNGWAPADDATRTYMRSIGWAEYDDTSALNREYVGAVSQGAVSTGAQLYYQKISGGASADFTFTDNINEGIQVFGDAANGNFDDRAFFKVFAREYQYKYASADLALVNETATGAYKIGFPVAANELDLKITDVDGTVGGATDPWQELSLKYFDTAFSIDVDLVGTPRDFGIVLDVGTHSGVDGATGASGSTLTSAEAGIVGADFTGGTVTIHEGADAGTYNISGTPTGTVVTITGTFPTGATGSSFTIQRATPITATKAQIYTWMHYQMRQNADINTVTGVITGNTADETMLFAGDTLECGKLVPANANGGGSGVFISGFNGVQAEDVTTIEFYDNGATLRKFPFIATGTLNFNSFLTSGGTGYYRMYFDDVPNALEDYGESSAITVNDKDGVPITGTITQAAINFNFAYDSNTQGGRTQATDADIIIVAGNAGSAKPVVATGTIGGTTGQSFTLTAEQDRGYSNPA